MKRVTSVLRAFRDRRWREMRDVVEAELALLSAQAMRLFRPPGQLVDVAARAQIEGSPLAAQTAECESVVLAMDRAMRYGVVRPRCLARAVALSRMLDAHGIAGHTIRIGVRKLDGSFVAHAWVERGNTVLGDTVGNTRGYVSLTEVSVSRDGLFSSRRNRAHSGLRLGENLSWTQ